MTAALICALAERGGTLSIDDHPDWTTALAEVVDPPAVSVRGTTLHVALAERVPLFRGQAWRLREGVPMPLGPDELRTLQDDLGCGDYERDPTGGALGFSGALVRLLGLEHHHGTHVRLGLCHKHGAATVAGHALTTGLGGLDMRRFGVGPEVFDQVPVEPLATWHQPGPWLLLVRAVPFELHRLVQPPDRPQLRGLLTRLLVNALGHRTLAPSRRDEPVRVDAWPHGLRMVSPGPLARRVTVTGGQLRGRWARNALVLSVLAGCTHDSEGRDLVTLAAHLGFRLSWAADDSSVTALLERDGCLVQARPKRTRRAADVREQLIRDAVRQLGEPTMSGIRSTTGIARSTLASDVARLVEAGVLERTEEATHSSRQRYRLAKDS